MTTEAQIIETDVATIIIVWKPSATDTDKIPTPSHVIDASKLWKRGYTAKEICKELKLNAGTKYSAHTEWLNRLRLAYPDLFPLRRAQQKK